MKNNTKFLLVASIKNCGIPTMFINAIIAFFTFTKGASIVSTVALNNFMTVIIGCSLLCPLFGGLILKGLEKEELLPIGSKGDHMIGKFVPNTLLFGVLVISVIGIVLFWIIPQILITLLSIEFAMPRTLWVVTLGIYSGFVATFAAYLGIMRAYYAKQK